MKSGVPHSGRPTLYISLMYIIKHYYMKAWGASDRCRALSSSSAIHSNADSSPMVENTRSNRYNGVKRSTLLERIRRDNMPRSTSMLITLVMSFALSRPGEAQPTWDDVVMLFQFSNVESMGTLR